MLGSLNQRASQPIDLEYKEAIKLKPIILRVVYLVWGWGNSTALPYLIEELYSSHLRSLAVPRPSGMWSLPSLKHYNPCHESTQIK